MSHEYKETKLNNFQLFVQLVYHSQDIIPPNKFLLFYVVCLVPSLYMLLCYWKQKFKYLKIIGCSFQTIILIMEYGHSSDFQSGQYSPIESKEANRVPTKALTTLDTSQLEKLIINNQMLNKKIRNLVESGVNLIESQSYNDAMAYFQEAENILEYAGSCGKFLNKILITATLENKACIYQRLWEQQKSYSYLEAILYNQSNTQQESYPSNQSQNQESIALSLHHQQNSAIYYLKFSAIASQIKNHEVALSSAFKGLKTIQLICKTSYEKIAKLTITEDMEKSTEILKQISQFDDKLDIRKMDEYTSKSKQVLADMKGAKQLKLPKQIVEMIQSFTIGEVMQIFPVTIDELTNIPSFQEQTSYVGSIFKALYFSIAFFAVATQLRFLTPSKIIIQKFSKCDELKKSQIYHLTAIYIAAKFVPCPTKYLTHIIKSYSNHYESEMKDYYDEQKNEEPFRKMSHKQTEKKHHKREGPRQSKEKRQEHWDHLEGEIGMNKPHHIGSVYKSKKSGMKVRNSSAQMNGNRNKKHLAKQKSSCFIKQAPKYMKKSNDEHGLIHISTETDEKMIKQKPKFQSIKMGKATKSIQNKSSKSKSKSPSVNLQKKKVKSPSKKAKKNAKFEQQYIQGDKKEKKKKQMMSKLNENKQRYANQYNHQYLKSSTSKLEDLPKGSKIGNKDLKKLYSNY